MIGSTKYTETPASGFPPGTPPWLPVPRTWVVAWMVAAAASVSLAPDGYAQDAGEAPAVAIAGGPSAPFSGATDWVAEEVARRWGIDATSLRLEWATPPESTDLSQASPLRLSGSGSGGHWVVIFEAPDGGHVGLRVRSGLVERVPVAARRLPRGTILSAEDIQYAERVRWGEPEGEGEAVQAGWSAGRVIRQGDPLRSPSVTPPYAVERGASVRVVFARGDVKLALDGIAVGNARLGESVTVRLATGRRLDGVASSGSVVTVAGGVS